MGKKSAFVDVFVEPVDFDENGGNIDFRMMYILYFKPFYLPYFPPALEVVFFQKWTPKKSRVLAMLPRGIPREI